MRYRKTRQSAVWSMLFLTLSVPWVQAANVSWDDGGLFSQLWSSNNNWDPNGSPAGHDITIGDLVSALGDTTLIDDTFSISSLTLMNDAGVINSPDGGLTDFELQVNGLTSVQSGAFMTLYGGAADALDTEQLEIVNGTVTLDSSQPVGLARLEIESGAASSLDIQANGLLTGNGRIDLEGSPISATRLMRNNGTLTAGAVGFFPVVVPASTLQITATSANARIDLDGTGSENGVVNVNQNATLDIDVQFNDDFNGELNLRSGSVFDTEFGQGMTVGSGGSVNVTTSGGVGLVGTAATISGGSFQMQDSTLTLASAFDKVIFESDAVFSSLATIENHGTMVFNGSLVAFPDFQMNGPNASITAGENSSVLISDSNFNLDGDGTASNVTTVEAGGKMTIALNDILADDNLQGTINLNGGELDFSNDADNLWSIGLLTGGWLNAGGASVSTVSGHDLNMYGNLTVEADAELRIETDQVNFGGDANINVQSGAILEVNTNSLWNNSSVSVSGAGTMRPGTVQVGSNTASYDVVWDVDNVDLDDGGMVDIRDGSSLTINADTIDPQDGKFSQDIVFGDQSTLNLNLNGASTAVFGALSTITVNANNNGYTNFLDTSNGTLVQIDGTLDVAGSAAIGSRVHFTDSASVDIQGATDFLRLSGGDQNSASANRISGATISGDGILEFDAASALFGSGNIDVDGLTGNGDVVAEGGLLDLTNSTILNLGTLGTQGSAAALNLSSGWNTANVTEVRLADGLIQGASITNDGALGINGWGTITAQIVNNSRVDAEDGGTLILDNPNNNWDGTANTGALNAITGSLELRDDTGYAFGGTVRARMGQEVFANGFALQFLPTASMELQGGTYRSTEDTDFLGSLTTSMGATDLGVDGEFRFVSGSTAILGSNLRLGNFETVVESGATFSGSAALVNRSNRQLTLLDGASVDVLVQNNGRMSIGNSAGQATGLDFQQFVDGLLEIELEGTAPIDFDRLSMTGIADLDGTLEVSLLGGFSPAVGDSFAFLSAVGGVTGTFSTIDLPSLGLGLGWNVDYQPTLVNLMVVALTGNPDATGDGVLDCFDIDAFVEEIVAGTNTDTYDLTGDGLVDNADLDQWLVEAGAVNLPSGNAYLVGDANLDGVVDGLDFIEWNSNKFTNTPAWCSGDFTADGVVDGLDFIAWNDNKFMASDGISAVPEPTSVWLLLLTSFVWLVARKSRR